MKKLTLALALVMVLSTLLGGIAMVASAEDAATPTKQLFTFSRVAYNPGAWGDDGWMLDQGNYPTDPTTVDPTIATEVTWSDFYFASWNATENRADLNVPILTFAENTEVTEIVLAAILANGTTESWRNPGIEVYAWNETAAAWDEVALTSADLDTTAEYKPETSWRCFGSYRLIFAEPVAAKTFMIYCSTPEQMLSTVDGEKVLLGDNFTYAKGTVVTAADTTVADTTVADTTVADTTVADTTVADTTVADTTVADTTVADTTVADVTEAVATTEADVTTGEGAADTADFAIASVALAAVAAAGVVLCSKKRKN